MREYGVVFCDDGELPEGLDWTFVRCDGRMCFFVKEERVSEATLEAAWAAYRQLEVVA